MADKKHFVPDTSRNPARPGYRSIPGSSFCLSPVCRQERQVAQARQREPLLQPLRGDPLRRAPAEQALAQGHLGLQPRRIGRQAMRWPNAMPAAGAKISVCRGHRDPQRNSSVMLFPSKRHELASRFNCKA